MGDNICQVGFGDTLGGDGVEWESREWDWIGWVDILNSFENLRVVMVATRNALNLGAAARAMSNFGVKTLRVVNPYDPAFREAKSALRGRNVLAEAEVFTSVAEAVKDCSLVVGTTAVGKRHLHHPLKRLEEGGKLIRKRLGGKSRGGLRTKNCVAILFGSEKRGLSNADLSHCHWLMRIPTDEKSASMNLGQAVAVCLYELARDAKATAGAEKIEYASSEVVERFTGMLSEALSVSGFFEIRKVIDLEDRMRRLVRRLNLPAKDADMWLGMMRQIVWGLKEGKR